MNGKLTINLPEELLDLLKEQAKVDYSTVASVVRRAIAKFFEEGEQQ